MRRMCLGGGGGRYQDADMARTHLQGRTVAGDAACAGCVRASPRVLRTSDDAETRAHP